MSLRIIAIVSKVVIVTGGLGGIGYATVRELLSNEAKYVAIIDLIDPDQALVMQLMEMLGYEFPRTTFGYYKCDVRNVDEFTATYDSIVEQKRYVDILINAAAVLNDRDVDLSVDVNIKAVINCTMIAIDRMGQHNDHPGGVVVNIASTVGLNTTQLFPVYCATKHAVVSFVRSMKVHCPKFGVRIMCVCPDITDTPMTSIDHLRRNTLSFVDLTVYEHMLQLKLSPHEVASAIIDMIFEGNIGDVWMIKKNNPIIKASEQFLV